MRIALLVAAVVVLAAAAWFVGGELLGLGRGGSREPAPGAGDGTLAGGGVEGAGDDAGPTVEAGPRLFGRPLSERVGKGGVVARVMDFRTGRPVGGGKALLAGTGFGAEAVSSRAVTSPDGSVGFAGVPAGEAYSLRIEAEGHPVFTTPAVAVAGGKTTDLGVLWLGRRGVLEGIVVDVEGKPVARASVGLYGEMPGLMEMMQDFMGLIGRLDQEQPPLVAAETSGAGRFRLEDVAPGPVSLLVRAPGFASTTARVSMTSEGAAEGEVRVVLQRGQFAAGRVVTTAGAGVAGARIALFAENDMEGWLYNRTFTETDRAGAFRVDTMPPGDRFQAVVAAGGYPTTFGRVQPGRDDNRVVLHDVLRVTVRVLTQGDDEPVEGASVALAIGTRTDVSEPETLPTGVTDRTGRVTIEGRAGFLQMAIVSHPDRPVGIWMGMSGGAIPGMMQGPESKEVSASTGEVVFRLPNAGLVTGRVTGQDGTPLPGARVSNFGFGIGGGMGVVTDTDGAYRLPVTRFGEAAAAMIVVQAAGHVQPKASMMLAGKPDASGNLVHDVAMERAAVVTGRVVDKDGRPLAGASVSFRGGESDGMMGMGEMLRPVVAYSAEDGSFLIDSATSAATATVVARRTGYVDTTSEEFAVGAGQSVRAPDVVMRRGATLVVRVLGPAGGLQAGARVQIDLPSGPGIDLMDLVKGDFDVATDERGVARAPNLPPGKATVTASARGYAPSRAEVEIPAGDDVERDVEVRLRPARPVSGRVIDEAGKPIQNASVRVTGGGSGDEYVPSATTTTDADGSFLLEGLPETPLRLTVRAAGRARQKVEVDRRREGLEVRLLPEDRTKAQRRTEVTTEIQKAMTELRAAKDEADRKVLTQRLQDLSAELVELGVEGVEDVIGAESGAVIQEELSEEAEEGGVSAGDVVVEEPVIVEDPKKAPGR